MKEFELVLKLSIKLLRRVLREFVTSTREVAELTFKDVLRYAARHNLLTLEKVDDWFFYRNYRNSTAHEYGDMAAKVVAILPEFICDANGILTFFHRHL